MADYYDSIGQADELTTNYERFQADKAAKEAMGPDAVWEGIKASASDVMSPFALKRAWDRNKSQFSEEPAWQVSEELKTDLMHEYNQDELKQLSESTSEAEFLAKKRYIQEDRDRLYAKSALGLTGIAADVAFSAMDPISWGLGLITGGLGVGAKSAGIAKAAKIALATGVENAAVEQILAMGDTQHQGIDTVMAFATGAAMGGAISPLIRAKKPGKAALLDEADDAFRMDAENYVTGEALRAVPRQPTNLDTYKIQRYVNTKSIELERAYDAKATWDGKKFGEAKKRVQEIDREIEVMKFKEDGPEEALGKVRDEQRAFIKEVQPEREAIKARYAETEMKLREKIDKLDKKLQEKDTPKTQAKLWKAETELREAAEKMTKEIADLESKLKGRIHKAEYKLRRALNAKAELKVGRRDELLTERLRLMKDIDTAIKAGRAGKELNMWNRMSTEQKAKQIFGDDLPMLDAEVARQNKGRADFDPKMNAKVHETVDVDDEGIITESKTAPFGSVGAAAAGFRPLHKLFDVNVPMRQVISRFAFDGGKVPKALEGWSVLPQFTKWAHSPFTRLSKSDNMAIRGLNYHLLSAGQGGPANPTGAAAVWSDIYSKQFRSALKNRVADGMDMYRAENNISRMKMLFKPEVTHQFYKDIITEVKYPGSVPSEGVRLAAEGCRDFFEVAGQSMKSKGVYGFENLNLDRNYFSTIVDEVRVADHCHSHGIDKVQALLSEAYQRGEYKLSKEIADYVARGYVARSLDHSLKMAEFPTKVKDVDIDRMVEGLKKAGVPDDVIEMFIYESAESNLTQGMSNRAKKSLLPDLQTELNGLKMIDLIESDVPKLLEAYTREAAGSSAMSKLGFKTRREAKEFLVELKKDAYNQGFNRQETDAEIQILSDCIDMIYGRSIEKNPGSPFVKNLSRVRDFTSMVRLQTMGISTIPEIARVTAKRGLGAVMEAVPDIGVFGTKGLRAGKKWSGELTNPKLKELEEMFYVTGEDHILYPGYLRIDNIEESATYKSLGSYVDNCLAQGRKYQEVISAFRYIQGSGEKLSLNALSNKMKRWADDQIDLNSFLTQADINDAGWHDGFLGQVKEWMQANPKTEMYEGKEVRLFNIGKMPLEMRERIVLGLHQLTMRDMQRPMIGELPTWMNKWFGATATQFRNFSLLSLNKQLIHDIRHDQMAGAIIAMHSMFLSFVAYGAKTLYNGIGKDQSYYQQAFSPSGLTFGLLNSMGQLASVGLAGDMMSTLGAMPSNWMASPGKSGFRAMSAESVPIVGMGTDILKTARSVSDLDVEKTIRDVHKIVPFGKAAGIHQALNAISGALD